MYSRLTLLTTSNKYSLCDPVNENSSRSHLTASTYSMSEHLGIFGSRSQKPMINIIIFTKEVRPGGGYLRIFGRRSEILKPMPPPQGYPTFSQDRQLACKMPLIKPE